MAVATLTLISHLAPVLSVRIIPFHKFRDGNLAPPCFRTMPQRRIFVAVRLPARFRF